MTKSGRQPEGIDQAEQGQDLEREQRSLREQGFVQRILIGRAVIGRPRHVAGGAALAEHHSEQRVSERAIQLSAHLLQRRPEDGKRLI